MPSSTHLTATSLLIVFLGAAATGAVEPPKPGERQVWASIQAVDSAARTGTALNEADRKPFSFTLPPDAALWRFGAPSALLDEFRPGDHVRLTAVAPAAGPWQVTRMGDSITDLLESKRSYRVTGQDRDNYTFTVEALNEKEEPLPEKLTVEYGRGTTLVLREDPVYVFKVQEGMRLWLNTARRTGSDIPIAREVLDEVTVKRFQAQQRLRTHARAWKPGSPVSYARDIRPMLEVNCLSCHREGKADSGYSISTPERMRAGGRRGPGIVAGKSGESLLYLTMSGDRNPRMPPDRDVIPAQLAMLKQWIDSGAALDDAKPAAR